MKSETKIIGFIPSRYASTRLPGKPLIDLAGKPMIQWVYEACDGVFDELYVLTDDERIEHVVKQFGGKVMMTSINHDNGTSRIMEGVEKLGIEDAIVVNIQGDEPMLDSEMLSAFCDFLREKKSEIGTLIARVEHVDELKSKSSVYVTKTIHDRALYFSRQVIPGAKKGSLDDWLAQHTYYKHLGIYAFSTEAIKKIKAMEPSPLEKMEELEQLRWLENGLEIDLFETNHFSISVDTLEDVKKVRPLLEQMKKI